LGATEGAGTQAHLPSAANGLQLPALQNLNPDHAALRQIQALYLSLLHHMQIASAEGRRNESALGIPALAVELRHLIPTHTLLFVAVEIRVDCIAALLSGVQEILVEGIV
jgi:hypothetical protein